MKSILVLGPNPAWQKTLFFPEFRYGHVNRAAEMMVFPSGKGINFSRAARCWGTTQTLLFQFAGGEIGGRLRRELDREGLKYLHIETEAETRTCTTCLCRKSGTMTEIIDPTPPLPRENVEQMLDAIRRNIASCSAVSITGTVPGGMKTDLYRQTAALACENGLPVLVDSWQNIDEVLALGGEMILKVNLDELAKITGVREPRRAIEIVFERYPVCAVAITDGPETAYAATREQAWSFQLPVLEDVVSPLGSGDTNAAVLFSEYLAGTSFEQAFAHALAAASANCLTPLCGSFERSASESLYRRIIISQL
jgi:fructose-1-phosphate kinase PfkB-like protein